jgi:hypothetical protein
VFHHEGLEEHEGRIADTEILSLLQRRSPFFVAFVRFAVNRKIFHGSYVAGVTDLR